MSMSSTITPNKQQITLLDKVCTHFILTMFQRPPDVRIVNISKKFKKTRTRNFERNNHVIPFEFRIKIPVPA